MRTPARFEITPGVTADDLKTPRECDDARSFLVAEIAAIQGKLSAFRASPESARNYDWERRAKGALRAKLACLSQVNIVRSRVNREHNDEQAKARPDKRKVLLAIVHELDAEIIDRAADIARARGLFD